MLEAALKNEKITPAELAEALLSFIHDIPTGGTSAEQRFYDIYKFVCDRVFGPILVGKDEKDRYHHREGGWLGEQTRWSRSSSQQKAQRRSSSSSNAAMRLPARGTNSNEKPSLETDPVVKLLGTAVGKSKSFDPPPATLIEAISTESANRPGWGFTLPFDALPKITQEAWLATFGTNPSIHSTDNTTKLLTKILRRGPQEQKELLTFLQRKDQTKQRFSMVQLSPRGFQNQGLHSPSPVKTKAGDVALDQDSPNVILGMLEYFLFLYFRFPQAKPVPKYNSVNSGMHSHSNFGQKTEPYGDTVYHFLFRKYLLYFLPYESEPNRQIGSSSDKRESELFVRTLITLWLETQGRVKPTNEVLNAINRRSLVAEPAELGLEFAYDVIQIQFNPPVRQIRQCLRSTVVHMILDPALGKSALRESSWSLPNAMEILQQPFYNHVRSSFRHASIHQSDSSPFYAALDAWLIWLEPWNVNEMNMRDFSPRQATQRIIGSTANNHAHRRRNVYYPKHNHKSRYSSVWEPYIAANLHVYATPLAIFLRRARELDFGAKKVQRSMTTLRRVFRVFTPEVVDAISRHLTGSSNLSHIVQRHNFTLGSFAPPPGPQTLSSCQNDMKALLEEIQFQHLKKVRDLDVVDRFLAYLESFFQSGVVSGEEREMHRLLERARVIVQLPPDYLPQTISQDQAMATAPKEAKEFIKNGELTDEGHRNVVMGATKISRYDVGFVGDRAKARAGTYELEILVDVSVWITEILKMKTGLDISLRPFADYRNCLAFWLLSYVFWLFVKSFFVSYYY
mmetsp:Transcript_29960/g.82219  ORF Transcript_29960/g.82219 Transcript_29960/m.82219 type:complete len:794 (-) Transcript_29960:157-2538(-)